MKQVYAQLLGYEVVCSDATDLTAHPTQWGDVTQWNGQQFSSATVATRVAIPEVEVLICAFADQTLKNVEAFGRSYVGDCSYGLLNNEQDVVLTAETDVAASSTDVNTTTNVFTLTAHTFRTGQLCRLTTSSVLPASLLVNTDYWIIKVDANKVMLASTLKNALAGTAIDITTTGTGNQTFNVPKATFRQKIAHSQGSLFYGFKVSSHTGSARVRITVSAVTRHDH